MQSIINELEKIIADYAPQLRQLNDEAFSFKPSPAKWSGKEYLGHLIDSAQNNIRRFVVAQYEDRPHIVYQQDTWVSAAGYQSYDPADLVNLWALLNKHIVALLKNMPAGMEEKEVLTGALHSIEWLAADYNKNLLHHLHQVLKLEPLPYP